MRLFEVIDPDRTAKNVADFLSGKGRFKYRGYPKLLEDEQVFGKVSPWVATSRGFMGQDTIGSKK